MPPKSSKTKTSVKKAAAATSTRKPAEAAKSKSNSTAKATAKSAEAPAKTGTKRAAPDETSSDDEHAEETAQKKARVNKEQAEATKSSQTTTMNTFQGGNLDLYAMALPFLRNALKPAGSTTSDYPALLKLIQSKQAKADNTARLVLSLPTSGSGGMGYGRLASGAEGFCEPFEDAPFDVGIASLEHVDKVTFTAAQKRELWPAADVPEDGPGIQGTMVLIDKPCGVNSASGTFKMLLVPVKDGMEMWAGAASFQVKYGSLYQRKGFGRGTIVTFGFWAVPSVKDDPRALECTELGYLATTKGNAVVDDVDSDEEEESDDDSDDGGYGYVW
uniref:Uncharacterized protein n=1 Tax=Mycena chlorophos TaxID=658473 RepID=A0ABQ0LRD8_MYCCL|nr:predicted protein [Mycena chlorophos]